MDASENSTSTGFLRLPTQFEALAGSVTNRDIIRKATSARYLQEEIYNNRIITDDFVQSTFNRDGDLYVVKPEIAELVEFGSGNVLDRELATRVAGSDVVFAQNGRFHPVAGTLSKRA